MHYHIETRYLYIYLVHRSIIDIKLAKIGDGVESVHQYGAWSMHIDIDTCYSWHSI